MEEVTLKTPSDGRLRRGEVKAVQPSHAEGCILKGPKAGTCQRTGVLRDHCMGHILEGGKYGC